MTQPFEDSGEADRLRELIEKERELKTQEAELRNIIENPNDFSLDAFYDARENYDLVAASLAGVSAEVGRLQSNMRNMGGGDLANLDAESAQLADLIEQRDNLLQQQRQLAATPKQFIERYYKNTGGRGGGEGEDSDGPVGDPLADFRDSLNVARAEYNNLKTLMDTGVGDVGFEEVSAGAEGLLGSLDKLIGQMQALNGAGQLAAEQQVELFNLAGERARLVAEINESPNVQRESEAGSWIERLATDAERGRLTWGAAMSEMRQAQQNLSSEFSQFEGLEVLTPEQQARFEMLTRLSDMLDSGLVDLQTRMDELGATNPLGRLGDSMRELIREQERIPERVLVKFEEAGGDRSIYDDYNARFEQLDAQQREFLAVQAELENSGAGNQELLGGVVIDEAVHRADALRIALEGAYGLDPDTQGLERRVRLWEQELAALDGAIVRERNLADAAAETARQRQAAQNSRALADQAYTQAGEDGGSQLEQQTARVAQLKSDLRAVGENSIAGQLIAADLEVAL